MGWDVVQIGLKHNLPVHDMHATARELSRRLNRNLRLNICDEYVYSKESHSIKSVPGWENYVEVDRYVIDDSNVFVNLVACNYQAKQLYQEIGAEGFLSLSFEDEQAKHILFHTDDGEYPLYELYYKDDDGNDVEIRLFKENVDLDFYVKEKWSLFAEAFSMECESDRLLEIRNKVLEQAKLFGCEEIVYCPDQGPGEYIFSKIFLPSDTLKDYILTKRYLLEYFDCDKVEYEEWLKDARYIDYQSYFDNGPMIAPGEFIEVIFDKVV